MAASQAIDMMLHKHNSSQVHCFSRVLFSKEVNGLHIWGIFNHNVPTSCRQVADNSPTDNQLSVICRPTDNQLSVICRPTAFLGELSLKITTTCTELTTRTFFIVFIEVLIMIMTKMTTNK